MDLIPEHRTTLHVLAFLYFRMGRMENAGRIYAALAAMPPDGKDRPDWRTLAGQAAVAIEQEDGETALAYVRSAMDAAPFLAEAPEKAVLNLMYAKALWLCGNKDEARAAASLLLQSGEKKADS